MPNSRRKINTAVKKKNYSKKLKDSKEINKTQGKHHSIMEIMGRTTNR